jgi:hypothetical protein
MSVEDEETLDNAIASLPFSDIFDVEMVQLEALKDALERDERLLKPAPARRSGAKAKTKKSK